MRVLLSVALVGAAFCAQMAESKTIPDKFMGKFKLEKSENFDELLAAKGVGWLVRKMIQMASVTKVVSKGSEAGKYNMENLTSKRNVKYADFELGVPFEDVGMDDTKHRITMDFDEAKDELTEHHVRLETAGDEGETYHYTIADGKLLLSMEHQGVKCRRWFKPL